VQRPKRRDRYIAFEFSEARFGREVAAAIRAAFAGRPAGERAEIIFFAGRRGLVRCAHTQAEEVTRALNAMRVGGSAVPIRTVGTSGTIRAARARYFSKP